VTSWTGWGHDSMRAALIYQHATKDADRRTADALAKHIDAHADAADQGGKGTPDGPGPAA
jgi:hypothetical protein